MPQERTSTPSPNARTKGAYPWQSVWIVGASSGIGRAAALDLAASGVHVFASARSVDALNELAEASDTITALPLDITDAGACAAAVAQFEALPDLVILCAAVYEPMDASTLSAKTAGWMMDVNYTGTVTCLEPLLARAKAEGRGHIALVSSPAAYRGLPGGAGYGPTKAALTNLAESLRCELELWGVRLRLVSPGFVRTRLTEKNDFDMPQLLEPEDAAQRMLRGLAGKAWEVAFPYPFLGLLKLLRVVPSSWYFAYARSLIRKAAAVRSGK